MRIALVLPISPATRGTGLAMRAGFWQRALAPLGDVTTFVLPLCGPFVEHENDVKVTPAWPSTTDSGLPPLARCATAPHGMQWARSHGPFDLVVAFRSYTGLFAAGLCAGSTAPLIVDLDDDDVDLAIQMGDGQSAEEYRRLLELLSGQASLLLAAAAAPDRHLVPNVTPRHSTSRTPSIERDHTSAIGVMVGNFTYQPNTAGAEWLVDHVMPLVNATRPDFRLRIIGPGSEAVAASGEGFVDDLADVYGAASVALVPVMQGSGTRIKALEAWGHGVPVVATTAGLGGLEAVDGQHALVADTPDEFARLILELLDSPELGRRIGGEGQRLVAARYSYDVVAAGAIGLLRDAVENLRTEPLALIMGLDVTEVDDGLVVFDPILGQAHHLNATAAIVFSLIDGHAVDAEILAQAQEIFSLDNPPTAEVDAAIDALHRARLIRRTPVQPRSDHCLEAVGT